MNEHTPTPWTVSTEPENQGWALVTDADGSVIANVNSETGPGATSAPVTRKMPSLANAAHIVRCVNAHDYLVASLESIKLNTGNHDTLTLYQAVGKLDIIARLVRATLDKVKEESNA